MAARLDYRNFHEVFGHGEAFPYDQHVLRDIESKRKTLGGVLFIDRVLTALGIRAKLYPPRDPRALHDLFQHILAAPMSSHHKLSALYYLLLDHDDNAGGTAARSHSQSHTPSSSSHFALHSGLPRRYQIFMTGLWHLDHLHPRVAVQHLAHPSLLPEFGDDIVRVLAKEGAKANGGNGDDSLLLAYYHAVRPVLRTPAAVALLFEALARTDPAGALAYARAQPAAARQPLFEKLVDMATASVVHLPLHADEDAWLRAYLTTGAGRALPHARDTLLMRQIVTGDVHVGDGALVGGNGNNNSNNDSTWAIVLQGLRNPPGSSSVAQ